jgi:cytochrome c5
MLQMKSPGSTVRRLVPFILVPLFTVGLAFGQQGEVIRAEIPYQFSVGAKVMPPGRYTFSVENSQLGVHSVGSGVFHVPIITRMGGPDTFLGHGSLVFDKTGGGRFLSEVWIPGTDGILLRSNPKGQSHEVLIVSSLNQARTVSGKAAYNQTCGRCHGSDGKGDGGADKFFNLTIPRLSSAEVQGKSDAELREIITKGSSAMPPVEIDEAGYRHRLPPQDIDAVIAYVRTLKR